MLEITENSGVHIKLQEQLSSSPRLFITDTQITLTDYNSKRDFFDKLNTLIGSIEEWLPIDKPDSLGFDAITKDLRLLYLSYSENNEIPENLNALQNAKKIIGVPQLSEECADFRVYPFLYRHYNLETNLFLCFGDEFANCNNFIELQVANDVSLFFGNNRYCAWGIYNPEKYISDSFESTVIHNTSTFLKNTLKNTFELICDENVDLMSREKDKELLNKIAHLHNQIVQHKEFPANGALVIIKNWLFDLADKFYWNIDFKHYFK